MKGKVIVTMLLACGLMQQGFAQHNRFVFFSSETELSAGPELAAVLPSGSGFGANIRYEQPLKVIDNMTVTANFGFMGYSSHATYSNNFGSYTASSNAWMLPLLAGAKYYYPGPVFRGLYASVEAGFSPGGSSVTYSGSATNALHPATLNGALLCPGAGIRHQQFDFAFRYYTTGLVAVRAAYVFRLK